MAKKSKLLAALDAHKGRDHKLEKQKKLQKQAARKKRSNSQFHSSDVEDEPIVGASFNGLKPEPEDESDGWESDESEDAVTGDVRLPQ